MEQSTTVMKTIAVGGGGSGGGLAAKPVFDIIEPTRPYISYPQKATERDASFSSYLRPAIEQQNNHVDDSEISIFDAQKYFNESGGDPKLSMRVSPVTANLERISERYDFSSVPRFASASSSVDGHGKNYRARSFHATPTASSEASWNSQTGLLSNPPGAIAISMRNPSRSDDQKKKRGGTKWLLGRKCPCSGKKSVQIQEKSSEFRTPSRVSHSKVSLDIKKQIQIQIPTSEENTMEKSLAPAPDHWLERHEVVPNTHRISADSKTSSERREVQIHNPHRISADNNRFPSGLSHQRVVATARSPFTTETTTGFSFPILSQTPPPIKLAVLPSTNHNPPLEDPPRDSLEVFRPADDPIPAKSVSEFHRRHSFTVMDDDMASDASSDLFEIESFSTQTTSYQMYPTRPDSLDDASSFNSRPLMTTINGGGGGGGGLYCRQSLDEPRTPSIAPTECYAPSEASIDWSVTTAEGFDKGSVTNFSVSASEVDEMTFIRPRDQCQKNGGGGGGGGGGSGGGKKRGGNGGLLMSCRCEKAVSVGPHPVKCVPADQGQRIISSTMRHVGGRAGIMNKPPLARSNSARLSLPFAA